MRRILEAPPKPPPRRWRRLHHCIVPSGLLMVLVGWALLGCQCEEEQKKPPTPHIVKPAPTPPPAEGEPLMEDLTRRRRGQGVRYVPPTPDQDRAFAKWVRRVTQAALRELAKSGNGYRANLAEYIEKPFSRLTYDEGIEVLRDNGVTIRYGEDFTSHDEQILVSLTGGAPLFLTEYPSDPRPKQGGVIKFFSMQRSKRNGNGFKCKESKDEITVCCDLLLPNVGETVGGAVRVGNPEKIRQQFKESLMFEHIRQTGLDPEREFNWYFETILNDNTQSAGCGIGFERLIQFITRAQSIKECVEFPRSPDYVTP